MRIGIDARFYGGEKAKGLGRYTEKLIEHLQIIDTTNEYFVFLQKEEYEQIPLHNKQFHKILADLDWYTIEEQINMPKIMGKYKLDLAHFPHYNVPLLYRRPFVVTIHDLILHHFPTKRASTLSSRMYFLKHLAYKLVIHRAVHRARKVITVSNFSKQDIRKTFNIPESRIAVTYEGVEPQCNAQSTTKPSKDYDLPEKYILYVGNAYPHKNLEMLLQVMKTLKQRAQESGSTLDWKLVLVGKEDYFYNRLRVRAQEMGVTDTVRFMGFVPDSDLPHLYEKALAYIFPSLYEGFGLPPLESMANGTPVLSSNASSMPEILQDKAIYFNPREENGIIKALETVLHNEQLRKKLREEGREFVKQYSWGNMAAATYRIYKACQPKQTLKNHIRNE